MIGSLHNTIDVNRVLFTLNFDSFDSKLLIITIVALIFANYVISGKYYFKYRQKYVERTTLLLLYERLSPVWAEHYRALQCTTCSREN